MYSFSLDEITCSKGTDHQANFSTWFVSERPEFKSAPNSITVSHSKIITSLLKKIKSFVTIIDLNSCCHALYPFPREIYVAIKTILFFKLRSNILVMSEQALVSFNSSIH